MELEPPLDLVRILDSNRVPQLSSKLSSIKPIMLIREVETHRSVLNPLNLVIGATSGKFKILLSLRESLLQQAWEISNKLARTEPRNPKHSAQSQV